MGLLKISTVRPEEEINEVKSKIYTKDDIAEHFGITERTLRYYQENGLLKAKRKGNRIIFTERDIEYLNLIQSFKDAGFSLSEIKTLNRVFRNSGRRNERQLKSYSQLDEILKKIELKKIEMERLKEDFLVIKRDIKHLLYLDGDAGFSQEILN